MNDLMQWFLDNNAFVLEVKTQLFSQRQSGVNKHYRVFTLPTQHFYIDSLEELTVERLQQETERRKREDDERDEQLWKLAQNTQMYL